MTDIRLEFRDVTKRFAGRQGSSQVITAVEGVSLGVSDGEVVEVNEHVAFMLQKDLLLPWRAIRNVDPDLINLARSFKASRMEIFWKIEFPASTPPLFAGLRIGATLAVIGVTVGEFVGGNIGLGYLLVLSAGSAETAKVFATIIMQTLIGVLAYWLVVAAERRVLHYLPSRGLESF